MSKKHKGRNKIEKFLLSQKADFHVLCAERAILWAQQHGFSVSQHSIDAVAYTKKFINSGMRMDWPNETLEAYEALGVYENFIVDVDEQGEPLDMVSAGIEYIVARMAWRVTENDDISNEVHAFQAIAGDNELLWERRLKEKLEAQT